MTVEEVLDSSTGLINSIINKYITYYEYDDLYQVASIGVITAYKKYNKERKVKFSTYAYTYILGEVIKFINDSRDFKVNRETRVLGKKIEQARESLAQKLSREPTNKDLSDYLSLDIRLINQVCNSYQRFESLEKIISEDGKSLSLLDTVSDKEQDRTDTIMLHDAIKKLDKEERKIIDYTYYKDYTQDKVASLTGKTQVQVSRTLSKTKNKLKSLIAP